MAPGSVCGQLTCLTDVFATLAEVTGFAYGDDAGEDSVSALSLWQGDDRPIREAVMHHSVFNYSIRKDQWKLEFCPGSGGMVKRGAGVPPERNPEGTPYQLYDLSADVRERRNLYGQRPEVERELTALARAYVENGRSTPGAKQQNCPAGRWPGLDWMNEA